MKIAVAQQFSRTPGARLRDEGPYSGQQFREEILEPAFLTHRMSEEGLVVDLDGTYGYGSAWLDEVFGGLARKYGIEEVLYAVSIISLEEPYLVEEIESYITQGR